MSLLRLVLSSNNNPQLVETYFEHGRGTTKSKTKATRGSDEGCFSWTRGVQAITVFFLRWAAWGLHRLDDPETGCPDIHGHRGTLAATLNDALTKKPIWLREVFGSDSSHNPRVEFIKRVNPDFKTMLDAPVKLSLDCDQLPPTNIQVFVSSKQVKDPDVLNALAEKIIAKHFHEQNGQDAVPTGDPYSIAIDGGVGTERGAHIPAIQSGDYGSRRTGQYDPKIESVIRKILDDIAREHLREKLKPRDENAYQPLELMFRVLNKDGYTHDRKWERFDTTKLLEPFGVYIVSSDTGTGKTTFLRNLQLQLLDQTEHIPIFIHASRIEKWEPDNVSAFAIHLARSFCPMLKEDETARFLEDGFNNKRIVLLVDGLDQIRGVGTEYDLLIGKLLKLAAYENLIIASRPTAVTGEETNEKVTFLQLEPFSKDVQKQYFGEYYKRAVELTANAPNLLAIPMLAYMVHTLIEKKQDKNIKNRARLYERFLNCVLKEYKHEHVTLSKEFRIRAKRSLMKISYDAIAQKIPTIQKIPLEFCYEDPCRLEVASDDLTKCGLVNLIVERGIGIEDYLYFTHQSFQEYLAAEWTAKSEERIDFILGEMWNPKWREVIMFLSGLEGERFIEKIYSEGCNDNCIHSRLFLAADCIIEYEDTCRLVQIIVPELRKLLFVAPFHIPSLNGLAAFGTDEDIDLIVSLLAERDKIPGGIRRDMSPYEIIGTLVKARDRLKRRHVEGIICFLETCSVKIYRDMPYLIGHLVEQLCPEDIERIIDIECKTAKRDCPTVMAFDPDSMITNKHIERIFQHVQYGDESTILRALSILRYFMGETRSFTMDCLDGSYENFTIIGSITKRLGNEHVEHLMDKLTHGPPRVQRRAFIAMTDMAREKRLSNSFLDRIMGCMESGDVATMNLIGTYLDGLSLVLKHEHIEKVIGYLSSMTPGGQARTLGSLRSLANMLVESDVETINLFLSSRSPKVKCACLEVLGACHAIAPDDTIDSVIWSLRTTDHSVFEVACQTLTSYESRMSQYQKEEILRFLKSRKHLLGYGGRHVKLGKATIDDVTGVLREIAGLERHVEDNSESSGDQLMNNQQEYRVNTRTDIVVSEQEISHIVDDLIGDGDVEAIAAYGLTEKNLHLLSKKHISRIVESYIATPNHWFRQQVICLIDQHDLAEYMESLMSLLENAETKRYSSPYYVISRLSSMMTPQHIDRIKKLLRDSDKRVRQHTYFLLRMIHRARGIS